VAMLNGLMLPKIFCSWCTMVAISDYTVMSYPPEVYSNEAEYTSYFVLVLISHVF